ncbi:MAG: hypothetical protein R2882_07990 [Gemmatimonadales bacterium]
MRRLVLSAVLVGQLSGCVSWRAQSRSVGEVLAEKPQDVIMVATSDSAKGFRVYQPRIIGDTLTGHPSETAILRLAVPVRDVTQVSTRYRHIGKSLLAGIAIVGGVALYGLLQSLNGTQP